MALPLTVAMSPSIGKGLMVMITRVAASPEFDARLIGMVVIYNAIGLRDDAAGRQVGLAMQKHPFPPLQRLRRDAHEPSPSCWLHQDGACLSTA